MTRLPVDIKQDVKCGFHVVLCHFPWICFTLCIVLGLRNNFCIFFFFFLLSEHIILVSCKIGLLHGFNFSS